MKVAVITGVTSGLGLEFLKIIISEHPELDEIWAIARRKDRLKDIEEKYNKIIPISLDLCDKDSISVFVRKLELEKPDIRVLINNAGFGDIGNFYENDYKKQMAMIDLNNRALTAMCTVCSPYMSKGSYIINVASIASFAPTPRMAVYCSTKAYVKSFSQCIRFELKDRGINVVALCPGPMSTEFIDIAGINSDGSKTFKTLPYVEPSYAAQKAVKFAKKGRSVCTPRFFYKLYRFIAKILPHNFVMFFSKT